MQDIYIKGAKTHNLKNIDLHLPRKKLIVITGVSGSGKSSLSIDTLYAEGQRKYIESLSSYARQFLNRMNKPDVEYIKGLCPAIAIEQKMAGGNNRSTVGTLTEIYDYLRLMYARIGITYSQKSNLPVRKDDVADVLNFVKDSMNNEDGFIGFSVISEKDITRQLNILLNKGFNRLWLDNNYHKIEDILDLDPKDQKKIKKYFIVVQRLSKNTHWDDTYFQQVSDSIQTALEENNYECSVVNTAANDIVTFNNKFEAEGVSYEVPTPQFFNFNNSYGACKICEGMGNVLGIDEDLVIPDKTRSIFEEAVAPWKGMKMKEYQKEFIKRAAENNFPIHRPYMDLNEKEKALLWKGDKKTEGIDHFFDMVHQNLYKIEYRILYSRYRGKTECPDCKGSRIRKDAQYVKIDGKNITELLKIPIKDVQQFFATITLTETEQKIAHRLLLEINNRLGFLMDVGLEYLSLDRVSGTLSGGESQRIALTRTLGSNLTDSLYILDEPSIGLHPRDTKNLINVLRKLRDLGNTVLVVEHEEEIMRACDYLVDIGPLAGVNGGNVVFAGKYSDILKAKNSLTAQYLLQKEKVSRTTSHQQFRQWIEILGARQNNLKNINVKIPLHAITAVSGVSGSGKTTLIKQILYPALMQKIGNYIEKPGLFVSLEGDWKKITHVEMIDQNPLGRSSRSNPVTYVKAYDYIRDLFASLPESKAKKFQPKDFSFNVAGGRCESCKGDGVQIVSMQFLADVALVCEECKGKRFQEELLEIKFKDNNIFDILEMTVSDAVDFFQDKKTIYDKIKPLNDIGLGYIKLGQSSSTLSGGEAQRVKLASFLNKNSHVTNHLFIFDEPTTGLHFYDVQKLLLAMEQLVAQGHTVVVIEHNLDIIRNADYIIDLGPEGGENGGHLVFQGLLDQLKECKSSYTSKFI